jgi:hypothetical protein
MPSTAPATAAVFTAREAPAIGEHLGHVESSASVERAALGEPRPSSEHGRGDAAEQRRTRGPARCRPSSARVTAAVIVEPAGPASRPLHGRGDAIGEPRRMLALDALDHLGEQNSGRPGCRSPPGQTERPLRLAPCLRDTAASERIVMVNFTNQ